MTNLYPKRRHPYGVAVEVFRTAAFRDAWERMVDPADREHVSRYFYANLHEFKWAALEPPATDTSHVRLTVDTTEDLARIEGLLESAS